MKKLDLIALMALKKKVMITSQQNFKSYKNFTSRIIKSSICSCLCYICIDVKAIASCLVKIYGRLYDVLMLFAKISLMRPG